MEYYLLIDGLKRGPYSFDNLLQNGLTKDALVWHTGMTDWKRAADMVELRELLEKMPPPPPSNGSVTPSSAIPPKSWLVESILVTLFCCLPFGIAGIVYACKVSSEYSAGNYEAALKDSQSAGKWTKIGFFVGLILLIIGGILPLLFGISIMGL